jgi:hypothetical protein
LTDNLKVNNLVLFQIEEGRLFHRTQPLYANNLAPQRLILGNKYYIATTFTWMFEINVQGFKWFLMGVHG